MTNRQDQFMSAIANFFYIVYETEQCYRYVWMEDAEEENFIAELPPSCRFLSSVSFCETLIFSELKAVLQSASSAPDTNTTRFRYEAGVEDRLIMNNQQDSQVGATSPEGHYNLQI